MSNACECGSQSGCHRLCVLCFGLTLGILWAAIVLGMGIAASASGLSYGSEFVDAIGTMYIGYGATFVGSIIGAIWAFVDGLIAGLLFAWLYNLFCSLCSCNKKETTTT